MSVRVVAYGNKWSFGELFEQFGIFNRVANANLFEYTFRKFGAFEGLIVVV